MAEFTDHFAARAGAYAAYRPSYPPEMIASLAQLAPERELAWDCGTGSGQAAVLLAEHFTRVVATDASVKQLEHARPHPRVEYRVATADASDLASASVDCVTVAQALHWFPLEPFYAEVARVLKPNGLLAVWTYNFFRVRADVDRILEAFYRRIGPHWPPERRHVESGYATLSFPFPELPRQPWQIAAQLDRRALVGYVGSWSAVERCRVAEGIDPLVELDADLARVWSDPATPLRVTWPIVLRAGRRPATP